MNDTQCDDNLENDFINQIDQLINFYDKEVVAQIKEENRKSSYLFNLLRNFDIGETKHSLIIAKLLDPNGDHGQGVLFLEKFLSQLDIQVNKNDNWSVTFETGRIDILIKRKNPPAVIIIENKSNNATDQDNQLYRYWLQEIFLPNKHEKYERILENKDYRLVYLSRDKNKIPDLKNSLNKPQKDGWEFLDKYDDLPSELPPNYMTYLTFEKDVIQWLTNCWKSVPKENHRISEFIKLYHDLIEEFTSKKIMETEKIDKTIAYFNSKNQNGSEKWNFFAELSDLKGQIIENWYSKLYNALGQKIVYNEAWKCVIWAKGIKWYLEEFGDQSISIWLEKENISLWVSAGYFDFIKIKDKLNNDPRYQPILGFIKADKFLGNGYLITEKGRYAFTDTNYNNFNSDQLAWFAGNQTDELVGQIQFKLEPFFKAEISELIIDLNNLGKK